MLEVVLGICYLLCSYDYLLEMGLIAQANSERVLLQLQAPEQLSDLPCPNNTFLEPNCPCFPSLRDGFEQTRERLTATPCST